jgi:peroxiredoxin
MALAQDKSDGDVSILIEIQRLVSPDPTIGDERQREEAFLQSLQKVPALVAGLETHFPKSPHLALAYSLALDALRLRYNSGDAGASLGDIAAGARRLAAVGLEDAYQAHAQFVLLEVAALEAIGASSQPASAATATAATGSATTASATSRSAAKMVRAADGFVQMAQKYDKTVHAPLALYWAGGLYLEAQRTETAIAAYERLSRGYPTDPCSLKALMLLVGLYGQQGSLSQQVQAKRRIVENFADTDIGLQYKSELALAESLGKPFHLRFLAVDGQNIDVRNYKGQRVLVYFYGVLADQTLGPSTLKTMTQLAQLAAKQKAVLLAIGADQEADADAVAKLLKDKNLAVPNLVDGNCKVAQQYGVVYVPSVLIVDEKGNLTGCVAAANIVPAVTKALAPASTQPASAPLGPAMP